MLLSTVFQQFYNIADSMIAGKYAGEAALAAIGDSYPITMILMSFCLGTNVGCSVVNSRLFGAKQNKEFCTSVNTGMIGASVTSIILTLVAYFLSTPLLNLCKTPSDVISNADIYLKIYAYGLIFLFVYNVANGIFTSMGDSITPLVFLICSSIGNVFLDILFVRDFKMGVAGAAWATFIAQGVAGILSVIVLYIKISKVFGQDFKESKIFSYSSFCKLAETSIPSILQQAFVSVGNVFIQVVVNSFGKSVMAGYAAAIKLNTFSIVTSATIGNGTSTFVAQNIGAKEHKRIGKGVRITLIMSLLLMTIFFFCYFFFPRIFVDMFMNKNDYSKTTVMTAVQFLRIVSPFYFFVAAKLVFDGALRGQGHMRSFMISTFADLLIRVGLVYILVGHFGTRGIWLSWPLGWVVGMIIACLLYIKGKKESEAMLINQVQA